jgi:diguanylate cyclase (GGDEF)-like protein
MAGTDVGGKRGRGRHIAVGVAVVWLCVMATGALVLAHSQSASRNALTARMQERVADGAGFASLYVRDIQQRERAQAREWLAGRTPDYNDLRVASAAFGAPAAVVLGGHGQVLQVLPAKPQLLGAVITGTYAHLRAAAAGHAAVSNVVPSAARGLPVVGFAIPYATRYGRRVFSPAFAVSGKLLGRYMSHVLVLPGRQVFLVDAGEDVIASTGRALDGEITLRSRDRRLAALASLHASGSYSSAQGKQVFATAAVAGTSWRVIGTDPAAELYASVDGSGSTLAWLALGGLTLAGLIIIAFGARLSESRDKLHVQARQLDRLARVDPLTGLSNRRDLSERLQAALTKADLDRAPLAVLLIDLDHFKQINDAFGHDAGDAVLISVAQSMRGLIRVGDTVGRWGGEEFLAILPNADAAAALLVAERLRSEIEQHPPLVDGAPVTVTVGGAVWTSGTVAELIGRADAALYLGKRAGRNTVRLTDADQPPLDSVPTQRPPEPVSV